MTGEVMWWPESLRESLLQVLDHREGWWPERGLSRCGYVRTSVEVNVEGHRVEAITYLSNPDGLFHCSTLSTADIVHILIHGTPTQRGSKALGAYYAREIAEHLNNAGYPDPMLNEILDEIDALTGWPEAQSA